MEARSAWVVELWVSGGRALDLESGSLASDNQLAL